MKVSDLVKNKSNTKVCMLLLFQISASSLAKEILNMKCDRKYKMYT